MGDTAVLESEVIDAKGMRHVYEFPRVADLPWWKKLPRFRHPKFTCNLMVDEYATRASSPAVTYSGSSGSRLKPIPFI